MLPVLCVQSSWTHYRPSTMPSQAVAGEEFLLMPWKVGANAESWSGSTHRAEDKGGALLSVKLDNRKSTEIILTTLLNSDLGAIDRDMRDR